MDDYISRKGTAEEIEGLPFNMSFALNEDELNGMNRAKTVIAHYILSTIPAADVVPVVRGKWVPVTNGRGGHECSECHNYAPSFQTGAEHLANFCPMCGADMREG